MSLGFFESLWWNDSLCSSCRKSLNYDYRKIVRNGITVHVLHEYKNEIRTCILRYKDYGDQYLARIFLVPFRWRVFFFYHDYVVVSVPSNDERVALRGFDHAAMMASYLGLPLISGVLSNQSIVRQAEKSKTDRLLISDSMKLLDPALIRGKKVLVVDDVMTTGSTLMACCELIKPHCLGVVALCVANVSLGVP